MSESIDRAGRNPDQDWRTVVDWPRVRRLHLLHGMFWAFGAAQAALYAAGLLAGTSRTLIGAAG